MEDTRLPKQLLFGWFEKTRPAEGLRQRWKDRIQADLRLLQVQQWYTSAQNRLEWRIICHTLPPDDTSLQSHFCPICQRTFRSLSGLRRHKRAAERSLLCLSSLARGSAQSVNDGFEVQEV